MRYGVFGAGHLGRIHLRCILESDRLELAGFYDPDPSTASRVAAELGVPAFPDAGSLIDACDIVDIVTPTLAHYGLACQAIEAGRHVFIEKPVTHTVEEARQLTGCTRGGWWYGTGMEMWLSRRGRTSYWTGYDPALA